MREIELIRTKNCAGNWVITHSCERKFVIFSSCHPDHDRSIWRKFLIWILVTSPELLIRLLSLHILSTPNLPFQSMKETKENPTFAQDCNTSLSCLRFSTHWLDLVDTWSIFSLTALRYSFIASVNAVRHPPFVPISRHPDVNFLLDGLEAIISGTACFWISGNMSETILVKIFTALLTFSRGGEWSSIKSDWGRISFQPGIKTVLKMS